MPSFTVTIDGQAYKTEATSKKAAEKKIKDHLKKDTKTSKPTNKMRYLFVLPIILIHSTTCPQTKPTDTNRDFGSWSSAQISYKFSIKMVSVWRNNTD